jgi:hypothetical protein
MRDHTGLAGFQHAVDQPEQVLAQGGQGDFGHMYMLGVRPVHVNATRGHGM